MLIVTDTSSNISLPNSKTSMNVAATTAAPGQDMSKTASLNSRSSVSDRTAAGEGTDEMMANKESYDDTDQTLGSDPEADRQRREHPFFDIPRSPPQVTA